MDRVAAAANLTKGALYWYFQDKEALFRETVVFVTRRAAEAVFGGAADARDIRRRLAAWERADPAGLAFLHRAHAEFMARPDDGAAAPLCDWHHALQRLIGGDAWKAWLVESQPFLRTCVVRDGPEPSLGGEPPGP